MYCFPCGGKYLCRNRTAMCETIGIKKYDGFCSHCFANLFPSDPRTSAIRTKSKEIAWVNALLQTETAADHEWNWDKPIYVVYNGGCCDSKRRIDLWTLIGNVVVAIEIDEEQHKKYPATYEASRYNDIVADFTGQYIFLRVNPDPYKLMSGQRVDPPFIERVAAVEDVLKKVLQTIETTTEWVQPVTIHHLFYDETE